MAECYKSIYGIGFFNDEDLHTVSNKTDLLNCVLTSKECFIIDCSFFEMTSNDIATLLADNEWVNQYLVFLDYHKTWLIVDINININKLFYLLP